MIPLGHKYKLVKTSTISTQFHSEKPIKKFIKFTMLMSDQLGSWGTHYLRQLLVKDLGIPHRHV